MNPEPHYFTYFLLSLFNERYPSKTAQLIHVFHGRRTPSMLFKVEQEKLFPAFGLFKSISREQLEHQLSFLTKRKWLLGNTDNGYILSETGKDQLDHYFAERFYPTEVKSLENATIRMPFFYRFQLAAQVLSEAAYGNRQYSPTIKDPVHQEAVKEWLSETGNPLSDLSQKWGSQLTTVLGNMDERYATILAWKLTGHGLIGKTNRQLSEELFLEEIELIFMLDQAIEQMIHRIDSTESSIFKSFLIEVRKTMYFGLSKSTYQTALSLKKGESLESIALKRKLKVNTIREHIIEIALVQHSFDFKPYIPLNIYKTLHQSFENDEQYSFQKAKKDHGDILFLWFRLVEIERIRNESSRT